MSIDQATQRAQQSLMQSLRRDIFTIARAGSLSGAIAGFVALTNAGGNPSLAGELAAQWSWLLLLALPLGVLNVALVLKLQNSERHISHYVSPSFWGRARLFILIAVVGALLGIVFEFVVANYVVVIFSGMKLDMVQVRAALQSHYPLPAALLAFVLTVAAALILASQKQTAR